MAASITPLRRGGLEAWASSLARASDDELVALFELRPDLRFPPPVSFMALAQAVVVPVSTLECLDRLDRSARQAAEALCVLGDASSVARLAAALGCQPGTLDPVLERLAAARLVLLDGRGIVVNPGLRAAARHPARLGRPANVLLAPKTSKELAEMGRRLQLKIPSGKNALLDALSAALGDQETVRSALIGAPEGTEALARRVSSVGPVLELGYSYSSYERHDSDRAPTGWLLRRGLLVSVSWGVAEMPAEVAIALRGGLIYPAYSPEQPPLAEQPVDALGVEAEAAQAALRCVADVVALLESLGSSPAKLLKGGGLGIREVRRLAKVVGRDEVITARLVELAGQADLIGIERSEQMVLPTAAFDRFLELSGPQRWRALAEAWLAAPIELSIAGTEDSDGKPMPPLLVRGPDAGARARRQVLAALLAAATPGRAPNPSSLCELADWRAPALYAIGPAQPARLVAWQLEESQQLGLTGSGAPSSFGRLLLGGDGDGAVALLEQAAPPIVREIVLQADLTAIAAGELPFELRAELELLADVESSGAATVFRFSEASLRRGLDAGRTSGEILTLLERHSPRGVPQSLAYLIEDLGRRHGRVRVGTARSYVRAEDPTLVTEVLAVRRLARLGLRALAPTVLVSEADPEVAIAALRDAGYLAAGEEADGTLSIRRPKSLRAPAGLWRAWDEDGDYDFEPEDLDILEDLDSERIEDLFGESSPVVLAAIARRRSQELGASSQRGPRHDAAEPAGAQALRDLVTRLRRGPAVADADGEPGGGSKGTGARPAGAGLGADALGADALGAGALGRLPLDLGLGTADAASGYLRPWGASGAARPSQIAKGVAGVTNLLESAIDHEWAVRLCWRDEEAPTYTREAYILPIELRRGFFDAELVDGEPLSIPTSQLVWARVLTEAEEEANVLMGEPY